MKVKEIREMTAEELSAKLVELKKELFNLRFQHAVNQLENPHKITEVKREIARVMTVLNANTKAVPTWSRAVDEPTNAGEV